MLKNFKYIVTSVAIAFIFMPSVLAQPATNAAQQPVDNYVTEKNFKSKVFDVKYRDPNSLASVIRQLGSGFKGATVTSSSDFRTITVRDFPENIATMEDAIKRLDTPATPRPNIELHMHALIASNSPGGGAEAPAELRDVLEQLRGTLNYKNYELAASVVQRLTESPSVLQGSGTVEIPGGTGGPLSLVMPYEYFIRGISLAQDTGGSFSVQIADFAFTTRTKDDQARVQTALSLHDGEKVVVGTATMRNRALVLVLTAKLIK